MHDTLFYMVTNDKPLRGAFNRLNNTDELKNVLNSLSNDIFGSFPMKNTTYISWQKSTQGIEKGRTESRRVKGRKKERKGCLPKNGAEAQKL